MNCNEYVCNLYYYICILIFISKYIFSISTSAEIIDLISLSLIKHLIKIIFVFQTFLISPHHLGSIIFTQFFQCSENRKRI